MSMATKKKVIEELQATGVENLKYLVILDTGANCNIVKDHALFGDAELHDEDVLIEGVSGVIKGKRKMGHVDQFGLCLYDEDVFMNILSECLAQKNKSLKLREVFKNDEKIGVDMEILGSNVVVSFRYVNGILIGDLTQWYIEKNNDDIKQVNEKYMYATKRVFEKNRKCIMDRVELEKAVHYVRRNQRRMGFMSDDHAEQVIKSGSHFNSAVRGDEFAKVTKVYGHDISQEMGKGTFDHQIPVYDYWDGVKPDEYLLEVDIMQIGPVYTLIGVAVKNNSDYKVSYTSGVNLGRRLSKRKLKLQDVKSVNMLLKAARQMVTHLRGKGMNVVKLISDDDATLSVIDEETWREQVGVTVKTLTSGVHAKRVENKQRVLKK
jgi:hypothetical protein